MIFGARLPARKMEEKFVHFFRLGLPGALQRRRALLVRCPNVRTGGDQCLCRADGIFGPIGTVRANGVRGPEKPSRAERLTRRLDFGTIPNQQFDAALQPWPLRESLPDHKGSGSRPR